MSTTAKRTIFDALCKVQSDLAEQGISKDQTNEYDRYKYRGIDDVLNAMAPILSQHGVLIVPSVYSAKTSPGVTSQGKSQMHAIVFVDYYLYDRNGDHIVHRSVGECMDRSDKAINKAMSAAFKYFLFQAFCIPLQGHDADGSSPEASMPVAAAAKFPEPPKAPIVPQAEVAPTQSAPVNEPTAAEFPMPSNEEEAARITDVLIALATGMHSSNLEELVTFWKENKHSVDMLDTYYPAQYQRLKAAFTQAKTALMEAANG